MCVHVCVGVCVCIYCVVIVMMIIIDCCTSDVYMSKFQLLWYRVASHSLLVFLGRMEPNSIKGSLKPLSTWGHPLLHVGG